jgi:uncharacterized protein YebE (UPF0316 family)
MENILNSTWFTWIVLPLLIFFIRILDVSLGTFRIILISRGKRSYAPLIGFIEILIWLLAIRQIFNNLNNWVCYIAYAGGFAAGNFIGLWLDSKLGIGYQVIRIITRFDSANLINDLKESGLGVTATDAVGNKGVVKIIFTVIPRKSINVVQDLIKKNNPNAFYSIEDVRSASEGIFPGKNTFGQNFFLKALKFERKSK